MAQQEQEYTDEFTVDNVAFRLSPLPSLVAEKLAPALTSLCTPALAAIFAGTRDAGELGKALANLSTSAEQLPKFREAFAARCQVVIGETGGVPVWTELKGKVFDDTFRRQHRRYFEWLGRCLAAEYGDFLAEIGRNLGEALEGSPFASLISSLGGSGDSPPTPESKTD